MKVYHRTQNDPRSPTMGSFSKNRHFFVRKIHFKVARKNVRFCLKPVVGKRIWNKSRVVKNVGIEYDRRKTKRKKLHILNIHITSCSYPKYFRIFRHPTTPQKRKTKNEKIKKSKKKLKFDALFQVNF